MEEAQIPFCKRKLGINTGKSNAIAIADDFKTSMKGVFAAGDVTSGETLVVKVYGKRTRGSTKSSRISNEFGIKPRVIL